MKRHYPLLRLSPEAAGKLQHDHTRALANLERLRNELTALELQVRTEFGPQILHLLRTNARNAALAQQLKREIAA
ncbi:hypothetical protein [Pseudomonas sp. XK-1]|uniref:hypothetical protein n=1 Tax=Pseudomonas sp. XK-1 TaxID=3136019 RepID=UPI003119E6DB